MATVTFRDHVRVELIRHNAGDEHVIQAAQVSAKGENKPDTVPERLINALTKHRHGSPFEHTSFTFFVEAPLFVFREWQRHRIGSFNEMSGRYSEMEPTFYIPSQTRPVINKGTSMVPKFVVDPDDVTPNNLVVNTLMLNAHRSWDFYEGLLESGVAKEVARMVLPLNIYSQMYWTVNARSLMNFLSLRVESEDSKFKSYPQYEIQMGAEKVEEIFASVMPLTHKAFVENGRVSP